VGYFASTVHAHIKDGHILTFSNMIAINIKLENPYNLPKLYVLSQYLNSVNIPVEKMHRPWPAHASELPLL
jgi:hypothetical protein